MGDGGVAVGDGGTGLMALTPVGYEACCDAAHDLCAHHVGVPLLAPGGVPELTMRTLWSSLVPHEHESRMPLL